jgi:hypothetical protein
VTGRPDLPAGGFSDWLHRTRASWLGNTSVDVPCGDCCACCSTSHFVHVGPGETGARAALPPELLFPAPGLPEGTTLLGYDARGHCPMLTGGRCTVYDSRPLTCRIYDCRVFAAAGIDADRARITRQARRWEFSYPTQKDRDEHAAVRAAATFVRERAACFPGGEAPVDPPQVAVLAVKVSDVFLERARLFPEELGRPVPRRSGAEPSSECSDVDREIARAIVAANERFAAARTVDHLAAPT